MKGNGNVEVFVLVTAEISKDIIEKYADPKCVLNNLKRVSETTGVELVRQENSAERFTVKGPWLAITKARSLLQTLLKTSNKNKLPNNFNTSKIFDDNELSPSINNLIEKRTENSKIHIPDPVVYYDGVDGDAKSSPTGHSAENDNVKTEKSEETINETVDDQIDEDLAVDFAISDDNKRDSDYLQEDEEDEPSPRKLRSRKNSKSRKNQSKKSKAKLPQLKKTKKLSENVLPSKRKATVKPQKVLSSVNKSEVGDMTKVKETSCVELEYQCNECNYVGKKKALLRQHRRRFHRTKDFPCEICGRIFGFNKDLTRHMKSHQKPENCCDICGKLYKGLRSLAEHRKTHAENYEKPEFQCDMCEKSFSTKYVLKYHVKSEHLGMKRTYLCPTCGKSFSQKHSYLQHANVHLGIRNYKCDMCDKAFAYEKSLREHKFMHDNIRRFKCQSCDKCFRQSSALAIHARIHKVVKDYVCSACGRGFSQKQALKRHERIHLGEKPFVCNLCSKNFTDSSVLRRHMILIHKKEPKKWREDTVSLVKKGQYFIDVLKDNEQSLEELEKAATLNEQRNLPNPEVQGVDSDQERMNEEKVMTNVTPEIPISQPVPQIQAYHHDSPNNSGTVLSVPAIAGLTTQNHIPPSYNPIAMYPNIDHNIYNLPSSSQYLQTQPINLHTLENVPQPPRGYYPHDYPPNLSSNKHYDMHNSN